MFTKLDGNGDALSFFSDGADQYLGIFDRNSVFDDFDGDPEPTGAVSYLSSSFRYLVAENVAGSGEVLPVRLLWSDIDVATFTDLLVDLRLASSGFQQFEAGDFLLLEGSFDGGAFIKLMEFRADGSGVLRQDSDFDGLGDGEEVDGFMDSFNLSFGVTGSSLDLRLSIATDDVGEDIGVDAVVLRGRRVNEWNVTGPASFFEPGNWSLGAVPDADAQAYLRNGGTAVADGSPVGHPSSLRVEGLVVGDVLGSGDLQISNLDFEVNENVSLTAGLQESLLTSGTFENLSGSLVVRNSNLLEFGSTVSIGDLVAGGTASTTGTATFEVENVGTFIIDGTLNIMDTLPTEQASVTGSATVTMRNVGTLNIESDLDICDGAPSTGPLFAPVADCSADVLFEDFTLLTVEDDLEIADGLAGEGGSVTTDVDVVFRDIQRLEVESDLALVTGDEIDGMGMEAAFNDLTAEVTFERVAVTVGNNFHINQLEIEQEARINSSMSLNLVSSSIVTESGSKSDIGSLTGGPGQAQNRVESTLHLVGSTILHRGAMTLGEQGALALGTVETVVELDDDSKMTVEDLNMEANATLRLHLDGTTSTLTGDSETRRRGGEAPDRFSTVESESASLDGEIVAVFDFVPAAGSYTFDLIRSSSGIAADSASFTVEGLDPGFSVDFFGVHSGDQEVVRLMISGAPAVADLALTLTNSVDSVVAGTQVAYTLVASNQGPSDEPLAVVTDEFAAKLSCAWTSVAAGGATGNSAGSGAVLDETLNLPNGSSVTYTIICDLAADASGTLIHSATIDGSRLDTNGSNEPAIDSDPVAQVADLAVTLDDLEVTALPGDLRIYTLVASNSGPSDVEAVPAVATFAAQLTGCTWSCSAGSGASCTSGPVDGNILDSVRLAAGSSVVYTAGCIVDPALDPSTESVVSSASILVPVSIQDPAVANNTAQDADAGPAQVIFRDGFESGDLTSWSASLP